ncbi:MAG: hypothetical protein ACI81R_002808 [Bradymonadia bacterium]|jgi:hypothetical protein
MDIINRFDIDAPAAAAWQLLGEEFGEVSRWADPVASSSLDGPLREGVTRMCTIKAIGPFPAGEVTERLSEFNRQKRVLTYEIKNGRPPFLSLLQNSWSLEGRGETSSVASSTMSYRVKWWALPFAPLIAMMMRRTLKPILAQFRDSVQTRHQGAHDARDAPSLSTN